MSVTALVIAAIVVLAAVPLLLLSWALCRMAALSEESAREQRRDAAVEKKGPR
jgi:hypothetical protein